MIPLPTEDPKREAFRLFEEGNYAGSLQCCNAVLLAEKDSGIEVLAATNLFYTGKLEDAEVFFRDLARKMPESSYVHSYLGKVLEARGDETAIAEYATAVHLDPDNQDALRSYAEFLLARKDYRGALPVLRRLVQLGKRTGDVKNLMRSQVELGEAKEALASHADFGGEETRGHEYIDALTWAGRFREAAGEAQALWKETADPAFLRKYLTALAQYDMPAALVAYGSHVRGEADEEVLFDYILLKKASGNTAEALDLVTRLVSRSRNPRYRLARCDLLAAAGDVNETLSAYEQLIRDELLTKNDLALLGQIITWYRQYLFAHVPAGEATRRFLGIVSGDVSAPGLIGTGKLYEDLGNEAEARAWYYRAYRADFLEGGIGYAKFLYAHGEERECEKVMLYILTNVKKGPDLTRVAAEVVTGDRKMYRLKRLMESLIRKLEERRSTLGSEGLELLTLSFFIAAANALEEGDFAACKYYCLCGMDVIPTHTKIIRLEDYLGLIRTCKEKTIADRPIMHAPGVKARAAPVTIDTGRQVHDQLDLTGQEQKIVDFLRSHRKATEMDLRTLLGTRRIAGIVNRLVQKASAQGITLVEKKGVGEDGEVYEYTGT